MQAAPFVAARTVLLLENRGTAINDPVTVQFRREAAEYARLASELVAGVTELVAAFGDANLPNRLISARDARAFDAALPPNNSIPVRVPPLWDLLQGCSTLLLAAPLSCAHDVVRVVLLLRSPCPTAEEVTQQLLPRLAQPRVGLLHVSVVPLGRGASEPFCVRLGRVRVAVVARPAQQQFLLPAADLRALHCGVASVPLRPVGGAPGGTFEAAAGLWVADADESFPASLTYRGVFAGPWAPYAAAQLVAAADAAGAALLQLARSCRGVALARSGGALVTHVLQLDGARFVLRSLASCLVETSEGRSSLCEAQAPSSADAAYPSGRELAINYAHSALLAPMLALIVPIVMTRQTPLVAADRDQTSAVRAAMQRLLTLRAADADGAWAQLEAAPLSRQAAWTQLLAELARFQQCCPALAALPALGAPHAARELHSLYSAAVSMRAPNAGLPASSATDARPLYPGLPERPPRFGGGDGE